MSTVAPRRRVRLGAACLLLLGLAFLQSPGQTTADTKFDLAVSPAQFLKRALHLWDPTAAFGQLQNQAYGYLWPMGPFFAGGHALGLSPWVTQRLWLGLLLCVAFLGAAQVARAFGVRSDVAVIVAGFAYATSPRLLSTVGPISIEAWPSALAPWVLLPLVLGSLRGSPRRAGLLSAVAVSMVGGVNAAATSAVLPLGVIWLLTRSNGRRRWSMLGWWAGFTVLGTAWWLIPLFLLGAYSPPFLDFIENADATTFPATIFDALRGTTDWVSYVDARWVAGHDMISLGFLALDAALLIGLGLVGIVHRAQPHRLFLVLSVLTGLFLTTMGHVGGVQGWFADPLHAALDGALAPLRNIHKFDPVVRLPLVLGLAHAVDRAIAARSALPLRVGGRTGRLRPGRLLTVLACLAVIGAATPAYAARLAPAEPVAQTPAYWSQAVRWLDDRPGGVTLLVPGSSFGQYLWGTPQDEPAQYLDADDWAVRNAVPLAPAGNIRMLDAIESRLAQGKGSTGLAAYLRRAGVSYLVVRNDLAGGDDVPDRALVRQALLDSPGLSVVKTFGPDVGGDPVLSGAGGRLLPNAGWQQHQAALEVYAVAPGSTTASAPNVSPSVAAASVPTVVGGPEDLLDLTDEGVLGEEPTQLAADLQAGTAPTGPVILTDGLQDRERSFGRVHDAASAVRTAGEARHTGNAEQDYQLPGGARWRTTARLVGASAITASSSRSDAGALGGSRPGDLPYAAIDGDPATQWVSDAVPGSAWWRIQLPTARRIDAVSLTLGDVGPHRLTVRVRTAAGVSEPVQLTAGDAGRVVLPSGSTDWLEVEPVVAGQFSLADITIPGVHVSRELVLPSVPTNWPTPQVISLRALRDARAGCVRVGSQTPCLAERGRPSEEPDGFTRVLSLPGGGNYTGRLSVVARPGEGLDELLEEGSPFSIRASSTGVADPRASALAAMDGDAGTTWVAAADDASPTLTAQWVSERRIRSITVAVAPSAPVRRPTAVLLSWPGGSQRVALDSGGRGRLATPIRTDRLSIEITESQPAAWTDGTGAWHGVPVGVSRLRIGTINHHALRPSPEVRRWACGSGPQITDGARQIRTRLVGSPAELYAMGEVTALPCGAVPLAAGVTRVTVTPTAAVTPTALVLRAGTTQLAPAMPTTVEHSGTTTRTIGAPGGSTVVTQRENANPGWTATQGGRALRPVQLDGWQQGWRTDGSAAPIAVRFAPDVRYRIGLAVGLSLLVLLWVLALLWRNRGHAGPPACGEASLPTPLLVVVGLGGCGLVAGWGGLVAGLAGAAIAVGGRRLGMERGGGRHPRSEDRSDAVAWTVVVVASLAAGTAYFLRPWGASAGWAGQWAWPHYTLVVALGVVVGSLVPLRSRGRRRMKGRSTSR